MKLKTIKEISAGHSPNLESETLSQVFTMLLFFPKPFKWQS